MARILGLLLVGLVFVGGVMPIASAEDPASADVIAALERRVAELQTQIVTLQQRAAAQASQSAPPAKALPWTELVDTEHLQARLTAAAKENQPVAVMIWAPWCSYCKAYRALIEKDPALRRGFEGLVRLEIDTEKSPRQDLREALGLAAGQPKFVFFDAAGEPVADARIESWAGQETTSLLKASLAKTAR